MTTEFIKARAGAAGEDSRRRRGIYDEAETVVTRNGSSGLVGFMRIARGPDVVLNHAVPYCVSCFSAVRARPRMMADATERDAMRGDFGRAADGP